MLAYCYLQLHFNIFTLGKALEAHVQQLQQSQDMLKQFDAQITRILSTTSWMKLFDFSEMTESPAVITAQVEQLKEKISLAQEKAKVRFFYQR